MLASDIAHCKQGSMVSLLIGHQIVSDFKNTVAYHLLIGYLIYQQLLINEYKMEWDLAIHIS